MNKTAVTEFILLGFDHIQRWTGILFILFLIIYVLTVVGNILIIVLVSISHRLQSPMYLFLRNLALCEVLFTTNIVPKMLQVILQGRSSISFAGCLSQLYVFAAAGIAECLLLTSMSYDRYVAICKPLHYSSIMSFRRHVYLVIFSWSCAIIQSAITIRLICFLDFCGSNTIDHFFCDFAPLMKLSCSDTTAIELEVSAQSIPVILFTFIYIIGTYVNIFYAILKISSTTRRQKAFSTCSSHLTVVSVYYGTIITLYITPNRQQLLKVNKSLSLLYSVVTPLLNPIIYSLRNQEIRKSFSLLILQKK